MLEIPERFNLAAYFLDDRLAEGRGAHPAVIDDRGTYDYSTVQAMSVRAAHALVERGILPEDRVLIALPDRVEFVAAFFCDAAHRRGGDDGQSRASRR